MYVRTAVHSTITTIPTYTRNIAVCDDRKAVDRLHVVEQAQLKS